MQLDSTDPLLLQSQELTNLQCILSNLGPDQYAAHILLWCYLLLGYTRYRLLAEVLVHEDMHFVRREAWFEFHFSINVLYLLRLCFKCAYDLAHRESFVRLWKALCYMFIMAGGRLLAFGRWDHFMCPTSSICRRLLREIVSIIFRCWLDGINKNDLTCPKLEQRLSAPCKTSSRNRLLIKENVI